MNKMAKPVSHHEALIYAMVTLSAADRTMTDRELMKIGDIVRTLPVFNDFDQDRLVAIAESVRRAPAGRRRARHRAGDHRQLAAAAPARHRLRLAVEVAAADLHVEQEELRFLQMLRDTLDLDKPDGRRDRARRPRPLPHALSAQKKPTGK